MSSSVAFHSVVSEKSKISRQIRDQGSHVGFPICPKNTNLVEDINTCCLWSFIEFCAVISEEKTNFSANQGPGWRSWFSDQPEKHKLDNLSSFDEFRSVVSKKSKISQRLNGNCRRQSEARAAIMVLRSTQKVQTLWRTLWSCFLSSFDEFRSVVSKKSKMSQPISGWGSLLGFPIGLKTRLRHDKFLLLYKSTRI